jgi:carbamate kinase
MAPKVAAACRFAEQTGRMAAIGALDQAQAILSGEAGTMVALRRPSEESLAATKG